MPDFKKMTSIEHYIIKSTTLLEEDTTDDLIEYFIQGYSDSITSHIIEEFNSKVECITSLEEYVYLEGHRVGDFDFNLGRYSTNFAEFRGIYKETIKSALMVSYLPDSVNVLNWWIVQLKEKLGWQIPVIACFSE